MQWASRPVGVLVSLLDARGRGALAAVALLQLVERLSLPAAALWVAERGGDAALAVFCVLGGVFFLASAARSVFRMHVQATVMSGLTTALLCGREAGSEGESQETELALVDGMYAAEETLSRRLPAMAADVPACAALAVFLCVREPWAVVVEGAAVVVVGGAVVMLVRRTMDAHARRVWDAFLPVFDDLLLAIHGRVEVVGNGVADVLLSRQARTLEAWRRRAFGAGVATFFAGRAPLAAAAVVAALVLVRHGGWQGVSVAWGAVLASVVPPFAGVAGGVLGLGRDLVRARPVIAALTGDEGPGQEAVEVASLPAPVTWSQVSFAYAGHERPALRGVDVTWSPGELVGLAGRNGSGKSTFVRLLLGLHEPSSGTIAVGGVPLARLDRAGLRRHVAFLAQRPFLPDHVTVHEAVRRLAPDATPRSIEAMLTRLGLWPVLLRRSPGAPLEVKLGALSAGERQRVALARVLLRDAKVVLLDEPDANLDGEGVEILVAILREEARSKMVMVVAHSPAVLAAADRVLRFEDGRVVST